MQDLYDENDSRIAIKPESGMIFHETITPTHLSVWLGVYALNTYKTSIKKTDSCCNSRYYGWQCISPGCKWIVCVQKGKKSNFQWTIREPGTKEQHFNLKHVNCSLYCNASVKVLHQAYNSNLICKETKAMHFLSSTMDTGVNFGSKKLPVNHADYNSSTKVGQDKAYRVVTSINLGKLDPFVFGFRYLPDYINRLRASNPGSIITLQGEHTEHESDEGQQRFVRLFMMLHQQAVCASNCKPVISYDGGFLKVITTAYITHNNIN
jgi:hypothetical protein